MAMTPEEQNRMRELEATVERLSSVEDVAFIEAMKRRLELEPTIARIVLAEIAKTSIGALSDVTISGIANNEILKWDSGSNTFEPASDAT